MEETQHFGKPSGIPIQGLNCNVNLRLPFYSSRNILLIYLSELIVQPVKLV